MTKFSFMILTIVFGSAAAYSAFAAWQFKIDKLKYIHLTNSTYTQTVGQKLRSDFDQVIKDIHNIMDTFTDQEGKDSDITLALFKSNPMLVSLTVFRLSPNNSITNNNVTTEYAIYNNDWNALNDFENDELNQLSLEELKRYRFTTLNDRSISENTQGLETEYFFDRFDKDLLFFVYPISQVGNLFSVFSVSKEFINTALANSDFTDLRLVRSNGSVLSSKKVEENGGSLKNSQLFQHSLESKVNEGSIEFGVLIDKIREEFIGNFIKLTNDLILLGETSKTEAFSGLTKILYNTVLFGVMAAALAIIVGVLFSRSVTLPLRKLMLVTEDIAAGRYDIVPQIQSQDEVGQLADYFTLLGRRLSEREAQLEQAIDMASKDGMTGVFNHRHFKSRFVDFFNLSKRNGNPLSLILTDIDHFKKFNDTYGHQQGDVVIKDLAKILSANARETDLVARYGGEEFVVVLPDTDLKGAVHVAERIRQAYLSHKIVNLAGGGTISSTCSLGVATFVNGNFKSIDEIIEHADQNLYKAKKNGRNQVVS